MFVANDHEQSILAADAHRENQYTCPGCGQNVILRQGHMRLTHFAHHAGTDCHLFSEGETKIHLMGKTKIFNWCRQNHLAVKLEAYLPKLKQRPDVLVYWHHHRTALEFQCSPISYERLEQRTKGYRINGYKVWWILGPTYLTSKLTLEKISKFAYFQKSLGLFVSFYNPQSDQFIVKHHITQDLFGKLKWRDYSFNPSKSAFNGFFNRIKTDTIDAQPDRYREALELQRRLLGRYTDKHLKQIQLICYAHHLNLAGCPWVIHAHDFRLPMGEHIPLEVKIKFLIKLQNTTRSHFSYQMLAAWFQESVQNNGLQFPNAINSQAYDELNFREWLQSLTSANLLKYNQNHYQLINSPFWYADITQKLRHFHS
ncbi:competence protein CoiA [Pediococcus ethanolidurans]|uniref:competence protein CoiA n=1 Tax=Pediococcus ethanolidurans TaxID=319653 RepID=UPI002952B0DF|nr:competence protein CoiA family protein [Pediococcus ethanolidurans]